MEVNFWLSVLSLALTVTSVVSQDCSTVGVTATVSITFGASVGEIPANLGNPLQLSCDATLGSTTGSIPTISRYIWEQNGLELNTNTRDYIVPEVQSSDGGQYRCGVITPLCTAYSNIRVVSTAPTITGVSDTVNGFEGDELTLTCQVEGYPLPTITWSKSGSTGMVATGSQLIINMANFSDAGNYTCTASNSRGSVDRSVEVNIQPAPTEPTTEPTEPTTGPVTEEPAGSGSQTTTEETKPKLEFYVAVAVTFVVCFLVALLVVILSIVGLYVAYKQKDGTEEVAPVEDEEGLVEMETLETTMPKPTKKKNRAKRKF